MSELSNESFEYRPTPDQMVSGFVDFTRIPPVFAEPSTTEVVTVIGPNSLFSRRGAPVIFNAPSLFVFNSLLLNRDRFANQDQLRTGFYEGLVAAGLSPDLGDQSQEARYESRTLFNQILFNLSHNLGPSLGLSQEVIYTDARKVRLSPDLIFYDEDGRRLSPTLPEPTELDIDFFAKRAKEAAIAGEEKLSRTHLINKGLKPGVLEDDPRIIREMVTKLQAEGGDSRMSTILAWRFGIPSKHTNYQSDERLAGLWQEAQNSGGLPADIVAQIVRPLFMGSLTSSDIDALILNYLKEKNS